VILRHVFGNQLDGDVHPFRVELAREMERLHDLQIRVSPQPVDHELRVRI
jgi:hypothetical protein